MWVLICTVSIVKVKAIFKEDLISVRIFIQYPTDSMRQVGSPQFIQELSCQYAGHTIFLAHLGPHVSSSPFISFSFKGAQKGDHIDLRWNDNQGNSQKKQATIE